MTGNTKVWRAPLAGLASVAMIATMGVAASTANAQTSDPATVAQYNFTVTFNGNGGTVFDSAAYADKGSIYAVSTKDNTAFADGKLSYTTSLTGYADTDLEEISASPAGDDSVFTGWYTAPTGGEKWNPSTFVNADITLYAHYADRGDIVYVRFTDDIKTESDGKTLVVSKADDKLASWELPTDTVKDWSALTGWQTVASDGGFNSSVDAGLPVSADNLTKKITDVLAKNSDGLDQTLVLAPTTTEATSVQFEVNNNAVYNVDVAYGEPISLPTGVDAYNATSYLRGVEWAEQKADGAVVEGPLTSSDANKQNAVNGVWKVTATKVQKAYAVSYYTEINGVDRQFATKIVDEKASAPTDAPAARGGDYSFAYYTKGANQNAGKHQYSDAQFTSPIVANTNLAAQWATKNVGVKFYLNYGGKTVTRSYQTGDTFKLPTASDSDVARSGWALYGWYVKANGDNPFAADESLSEFGYYNGKDDSKADNGLVNKRGQSPSSYKQYLLRADARLRINEAGQLQYENTKVPNGYDPTTGEQKYTTWWITIPSTLYAAWQRADKNEVNAAINTIPTTDKNGYISDSPVYKADSWTAYRTEIESVQAELAKPGLTNAQYAELLARVQAAQAKLEVKTDQTVYRLYNTQTGDHYFTAKQKEYDYLKTIGVNGEGAKFTAVSVDTVDKYNLPDTVVTALYSVYNQNTGEHLLVQKTEAEGLKAAGWNWDNDEKPVFYAPNAGGTEAVRRVYNPNTNLAAHVYTAEAKEYTDLTSWGWKADNDGNPLFYLDAAK